MKTLVAFVLIAILSAALYFGSCELLSDDNGTLGGDPSPMGAVNNEWDVTTIEGVSNPKVIVTAQNGDVSTVKYSADITDPTLLAIVKAMPDVEVIGNKASVTRKYRITKEGFQSAYDEGNLMIVKYGAKVGDTYTLEHNGKTLERKVTHVSTTDDYAWGFMDIKVTKVEESGRGIPGVSKFEFIGNHRFGIVGLTIYFEDGSTKKIGIFSDVINE